MILKLATEQDLRIDYCAEDYSTITITCDGNVAYDVFKMLTDTALESVTVIANDETIVGVFRNKHVKQYNYNGSTAVYVLEDIPSTEVAITDIQMALIELYEMLG